MGVGGMQQLFQAAQGALSGGCLEDGWRLCVRRAYDGSCGPSGGGSCCCVLLCHAVPAAQGEAGYHSQWDSKLLNYSNYETLRYLLSNLRYWIQEMR